MLELSKKDLDIYKDNLGKRKKSFRIMRKRGDKHLVVSGKMVAKLKRDTTISYNNKQEAQEILSLLSTVKKSINKYLVAKDFTLDALSKKYNSVYTNRPLFESLEIGTQFYYVDVKHCYWRVAYLNGYISEYFYNKVLEKPDLKLYRNMALSCIIAANHVDYYPLGKKGSTISEDTSLYEVLYHNILYSVWNIFGTLCFEKIGQDNCIGYFTDGIMIFEKDLKKVKTTLARYQLQFRVIECEKTDLREYVYTEDGTVRRV